jgi:hypothetical protein
MWIDDHEWPWPHHPLNLVDPPPPEDEDAAPGEPTLEPDTAVTVQAFQVRPLTVDACAAWCGGQVATINGGPAVVLPRAAVAGLGDYVVQDGARFKVEPAAGFAQRFTPAAT